MNVRNIMEDEVFRVIHDVADEDQSSISPQYTTGQQCCTDAACYVLNRLQPKYVTSARGQTYAEKDIHLNPQIHADILALVHEGFRRVTSIQRSFYNESGDHSEAKANYHFHFPVVKGRLLNGLTFEPIRDVSVQLLHNGAPVDMIDSNWENPYVLAGQTNGLYAFWPKPIAAEKLKLKNDFAFELRVHHASFEPLQHSLVISALSRETQREDLVNAQDHRLPDMYLVPLD